MFCKILIANRGEIACRVIRTAKRLGIRTVAIYSDADAEAMHVKLADEAYHVGAAPVGESYLMFDRILAAAKQSGADAIHPGYGFLSENADFASACEQAGVKFIGPPVKAIEAMGSKSAAKQIMSAAGVPLVPGYHEEDQSVERLQLAADSIGYPLLVKASAGGGGKGMRVVESSSDFISALEGAKREAASAFGNDHVLLEKYIRQPRHVEIQIFADVHGECVHLFERDCSVQRRHQKIIEEAPAPGLDDDLRQRMGQAAITAARAIDYIGAGTVEFLLDANGDFYFMEMNTRLQVEHPVTEMITGQDLVEWQVRVAAGEKLPCQQNELTISGHAVEVRIYAEDPANNFLPSIGVLRHLRQPHENAHVRVDSGVQQGDEISLHYDPMIAKLIVWDHDRTRALRRLRQALNEYQVVGVKTNLAFLSTAVTLPSFTAAEINTHFIEQNEVSLFPGDSAFPDEVLALACLDILLRQSDVANRPDHLSADPFSPWNAKNGWRLNSDNHHVLAFHNDRDRFDVTAHYRNDGYILELPNGDLHVSGSVDDSGDIYADLGGRRCRATVVRHAKELTILFAGTSFILLVEDTSLDAVEADSGDNRLSAPMPGKVVAIHVAEGAVVKIGSPLLVLEAMKMEHTIAAPADGCVESLPFAVGDMVSEGDEVVVFASEGKGE